MNEKNFIKTDNLKLIIIAGILSLIASKIPFSNFILFPFKLFVTYLHEASHGLSAILTGGELLSFTMKLDTSGLAYTSGGIRPIVISAGYLGSSICGSFLLLAALKKGSEKIVLNSLGIFFLVFSLLYARSFVSFFSGIFFGLFMLALGKLKNRTFLSIFLMFLSVQVCFNSLDNIFDLLFFPSNIRTDAQSMSEYFYGIFPPILIALVWLITSIAMYLFTLKIALLNQKDNV